MPSVGAERGRMIVWVSIAFFALFIGLAFYGWAKNRK